MTKKTRRITLPVTLEDARDCPRCGSRPGKVYHYPQRSSVAYCPTCKATYSPGPARQVALPPTYPHGPHLPDYARGPEHAAMCGYHAQHCRVRYVRGRASEHTCVKCEAPAENWALDPDADPAWLVSGPTGPPEDPRPRTWSLDIYAYRPLCIPCHWAETDDEPFKVGAQRANQERRTTPTPSEDV